MAAERHGAFPLGHVDSGKSAYDALLLPIDLTGTVTWCTIYPWVVTTVLTRSLSNHWEGNEGAEQ